jgi:hypothetical protein
MFYFLSGLGRCFLWFGQDGYRHGQRLELAFCPDKKDKLVAHLSLGSLEQLMPVDDVPFKVLQPQASPTQPEQKLTTFFAHDLIASGRRLARSPITSSPLTGLSRVRFSATDVGVTVKLQNV